MPRLILADPGWSFTHKALLVYDTLLTARKEMALIWRKCSLGFAVLYCANRHSALLNRLLFVLERSHWVGQSRLSCSIILWLEALSLVTAWLAIAAFSALRAYALSGKRPWVLAVVLCFGLVLPVAEIYQRAVMSAFVYKPPRVGCGSTTRGYLETYRFLATGSRACAVIADLLVLAVTLAQTRQARRRPSRSGTQSLSRLLYTDGTVYFAVLFLFNLCDIIFLQLAINGALADLVTVLSVILVARFLLRLRKLSEDDWSQGTALSSVEIGHSRFASASLFNTLGRSVGSEDEPDGGAGASCASAT
ncbi:hypothetical protein C8Q77DRAFT_1146681 [Trametes polyzona]|nr:hypothetical protein C8Q77DRAFT_1146681 [Trametes polyzona]